MGLWRAALLLVLPALAQAGGSFDWIREIGSGQDFSLGLATDSRGNIYVAGNTNSPGFPVQSPVQPCLASAGNSDVFVVKLDSGGNVLYSTCIGGSADDMAYAFAVDAAGGVYVTGLTYSSDFPSTRNAYQSAPPAASPSGEKGASFVFKLKADGTVAYSTFFTTSLNRPFAISVDAAGSVYVAGTSSGGLPVTAGAYRTVCSCGVTSNGFFGVITVDGFLARLDATGSNLVFATYLGFNSLAGGSLSIPLVVGSDGTAYIGAASGIYRLSADGAALLAKGTPNLSVQTMTLAADGTLYAAGGALSGFQPTSSAAQKDPNIFPPLDYQFRVDQPTAIIKVDASLNTIAASYFGGPYGDAIRSIAVDSSGNVLVAGGFPPHGLPTRSPIFQAFGSPGTGFAAVLAGDLSTIQFSSYFGDAENFTVNSVAAGDGSSLLLAGMTFNPQVNAAQGAVWLNKVRWTAPQPLRIDSVVNAASRIDDPIAGGETIVVDGAGFGADSRLEIGAAEVQPLTVTPHEITAVVPAGLDGNAAAVQVKSGGGVSNSVLVPVASASPGLFSADGSGKGQALAFNQDGSRNGPDHPARPGDQITVLVTGVGPVSFDQGYAVTATPVSAFIYEFYCLGVAAVMGPVDGLPGDVYQLTVYIPTYERITAANPDLKTFRYPPQTSFVLRIAGGTSQNGLWISILP